VKPASFPFDIDQDMLFTLLVLLAIFHCGILRVLMVCYWDAPACCDGSTDTDYIYNP